MLSLRGHGGGWRAERLGNWRRLPAFSELEPTNCRSDIIGMEASMKPSTGHMRPRRLLGAMLILVAAAGLAGCGVVAAPVRVTSAAVKVVPVAGDVVAAPLDVTADVID
jgi:hypothetical protein